MSMKACNQCAHCFERRPSRYSLCHRPVPKINPVTGTPYVLGVPCHRERALSWWTLRCGPGAAYWTPKETNEGDEIA